MPRSADLTEPDLIAHLEAQNASIGFTSFTYDDAYALGTDIVQRAIDGDLGITTTILFGGQCVFHAARPGTSADNDDWLARKARVVARFNAPSLLVGAKLRLRGADLADLGLDRALYAPAGGGFPLRVNGSLVGFVGVSGLAQHDDHDLVVAALEAAIARHP
ncbi:heme-degrading domain-containing protein [Microbacterium rhizomatis]|uniref:Heme-degrading domain-containing protein n=1 Tax=Microbacterium rhizomatis TaxID=1631477 RepID=A0A5J5J069_9MICO|nr:heme-degrading domain-containing protein [Microbacterium rhizomatis]KAA9107911.1 heme-degrading domain-containing protein [Microbacterium rhizomatis]